MKALRMISLIIVAVFIGSVPMFAGCFSDCQATYENCTDAANMTYSNCQSDCYYQYSPYYCDEQETACLWETYDCWPIAMYRQYFPDWTQWPSYCQPCHFEHEWCLAYGYSSCMSACNQDWTNSLMGCQYIEVQCYQTCCGDTLCEGDENCSTCSADCGPC
jgi:hypothetical protein